MRRAVRALIAASSLLLMFALGGCAALLRQPAPTDRAPPVLEGFKVVRYYPMNPAAPPPASVGDAYQADGDTLVYNCLAVSGEGPEYDGTLKEAYTTVDAQRLFLAHSLMRLLWREFLTAIPHDYVPSSLEEFNLAEMVQQYDLGLGMGEKGIPWQRVPPGYQK